MTFAMIETKESMDNIDAILAVDGLDGIFVGSGDLKLSLTGKAGHANNSPLFDEAIDKILGLCGKHGVIQGIWCANIDDAKKMRELGFRFIAIKSDSMMLIEAAKHIIDEFKN
jgi:4-hydroxy-2-oxoheptanedioate aldolase